MEERDKRFASKTEEHIQGRAVVRLFILYTRQEDLVIDPAAGDGVAPDACLLMNRRCRAFNAAAKNSKRRPDVEKFDFRKTPKPKGFKSELKGKADFIFLHSTIHSEYPENYMDNPAKN
ncbi:hypothetical protein AKJ39_03510 [candidate division MSBL1 archaeon SCGC-AAA259J03]|uniref:Uncharacterized protein n=1 Tax=candidate division MSBL1 archaeon SCGC-AAA259J03 TaxID=1698269 RepID=A0A656YXH1_9EURY|nr:hypothetical protein AKJ39_03510 [candidate division MSBL1 archaeon SCGC-AAA259J03]